MSQLWIDMLPPEMQTIPAIVAGFFALTGLVLWSAGIKVARAMLACFFGVVLAGVAMWILPAFMGLADVSAGIIGLVAGILIGAVAFRVLQGAVLAACLGVAVCGGYYRLETQSLPNLKPAHAVHAAELKVPIQNLPATPADAKRVFSDANPGRVASDTARAVSDQWQTIAPPLRQRMLILGLAVAVVAMAVAWMVPKHITWVMTAVGGAALLIYGVQVLLHVYAPRFQNWVPSGMLARIGFLSVIVLFGMLMQRMLFWPGRRQKRERQKDVGTGHPAMT